jgi:hypothetical protein
MSHDSDKTASNKLGVTQIGFEVKNDFKFLYKDGFHEIFNINIIY